jgi:XTP/dITP diphosphohydrolase
VKSPESNVESPTSTTLLVATTSADKLKEIFAELGGLSITFKTLNDYPGVDIPEETGTTFAENARQKALHYARATGLPIMAEDSGFEVGALDAAPGIYSARYLRPEATYPERFNAIYEAVKAKGLSTSAVRYVCAVALASDNDIVFETAGVVEGRLAARPAGTGGFGYDPIFYYPPYGRTFGEVSPREKAAVSHRGLALRALGAYLSSTSSSRR